MILEYLPYLILLVLSPLVGKYALRFVYPDIKTYVKSKKMAMFIVFGFAAYVPAVAIALTEIVIPLYSPIGAKPMLFDYEGNTFFAFAVFLGVLTINSSMVDFVIVRHRKVTVGLPTHVIRYGITKEMAKSKQTKRAKEISKITSDLKEILKEQKDVNDLLDRIKASVQKERAEFFDGLKNGDISLPGEESNWMGELREAGVKKKAIAKAPVKELKIPGEESNWMGELREAGITKKSVVSEEHIVAVTPKQDEHEKLILELEERLKKATEGSTKAKKTQELLDELREKLHEGDEGSKGKVYESSDLDEITNSLRSMQGKREDIGTHIKHGRKAAFEEELPEDELGGSLQSYPRAHSRTSGEENMWKTLVGDVRQQLIEPKSRKVEEKAASKRWYENVEASKVETPENVELFEGDLTNQNIGEELGELGELGDGLGELGDISDLESIDQNLESGDFDGMFVDVGSVKGGGCPNCGKKGTSIAYCSNCGKPLCSNCAASVEGGDEFIKYKCPHCSEEFAMKRRMPA